MQTNLLIETLMPIPFVEGGRDYSGMDCWGIVIEGFRLIDPSLVLPEINAHCGILNSQEVSQVITGTMPQFKKVDNTIFPSIIVIKYNDPIYSNHVGIYLGESKFIHTRYKVGVAVDSIESSAWRRKIEGYYIFKGDNRG